MLATMGLSFDHIASPPLHDFTATAPPGAIIGLLSDDVTAQRNLLRAAAGLDRPQAGQVGSTGPARIIGPFDPLDLSPVDNLLLDHALAFHGGAVRAQATFALEGLRRAGSTILIASQEHALLESLCDEIWWIEAGSLARQGHPREVLDAYLGNIAQQVKTWGETVPQQLRPRFRRGDGRARILAIDTFNGQGAPSVVWTAHEMAAVRVTVQFEAPVEDPVIGILIRTRLGFEVYGTNTQLDGLNLGPAAAGETRSVTFQFPCHLCAQDYTLTAASHDPDGLWHEWLEDAISVHVTDSRFTAGVANLHAKTVLG
jgi:hypothetical protein